MKPINKCWVILILGISFSVTACGQTKDKTEVKDVKTVASSQDSKVEDKITEDVDGKEFTLQNDKGKCSLSFEKNTLLLDLPWGCNFHRLPNNKVRVFPRDFYEAKNKATPNNYKDMQIILIEYSKPAENNPKECRTELQAIKIVKGKVTKSAKMKNLAACPPFQWDNVNFIGPFE